MATIKELLSAMIDKINGNEDKIDNIKGVPEAFDSITMTNGTDIANLTMSAEKELLFDGEAIGGGSGGGGSFSVKFVVSGGTVTADKTIDEINAVVSTGGAVDVSINYEGTILSANYAYSAGMGVIFTSTVIEPSDPATMAVGMMILITVGHFGDGWKQSMAVFTPAEL